MAIWARYKVDGIMFRTYLKFINMKFQPELKPLMSELVHIWQRIISRFQKRKTKQKKPSVKAYFKASWVSYTSKKKYNSILRDSQSKTNGIKLPSKERKFLKPRGNRTLGKHDDVFKIQKFGRK